MSSKTATKVEQKVAKHLIPKDTFIDTYVSTIPKDLSLNVRERIFDVHKTVLIMYSEVLKNMLSDKFQVDNKLDHDPAIFSKFIDLLYCKPIEYTFEEHIELINLADYYQIDVLLKNLSDQLETRITKENAYLAYKKINHEKTKEVCLTLLGEYLVENYQNDIMISQITDENDIIKCIEQHRKNIQTDKTDDDEFSMIEWIYVRIINKWIKKHQEEKRKEYCDKMTSIIELGNFTERCLIRNRGFLSNTLYFDTLDIHEAVFEKRKRYYDELEKRKNINKK